MFSEIWYFLIVTGVVGIACGALWAWGIYMHSKSGPLEKFVSIAGLACLNSALAIEAFLVT